MKIFKDLQLRSDLCQLFNLRAVKFLIYILLSVKAFKGGGDHFREIILETFSIGKKSLHCNDHFFLLSLKLE